MSTVRRLATIILLVLGVTIVSLPQASVFGVGPASVNVPASPVPESADFATRSLRDPWDMSEYSDVSQYINNAGQLDLVRNIQVQNGVFSGQSTPTKDAYFFALFPGYQDTTLIGKIGARYPIPAATYHCLYIAMRVDSGAANTNGAPGPDQFQVFWFGDERLNLPGAPWGFSTGIRLYPEAGAGAPTPGYRLYMVDLATTASGGTPWSGRSTWAGLRIDPTIQANVNFAVDWVRLTTCDDSNQTITWTPDGSVNAIWLRPVGTTRDIRVATGVNGGSGSFQLDTQGIAPGSYLVGMGTTTTCCASRSTQPLIINQTPVATFARPSFTSGTDYATQAGNPWDFNDPADTSSIANMTATYQNGVLDMVTPSGPLPAGVDARVNLNTPVPLNTTTYRYLTFRMYTAGPWQDGPRGMMIRWIWTIPSLSGGAGFECTLVSQDIPYDVGWQTYTVDLFDAFQGSAEETSPSGPPHCPNLPARWPERSPVTRMRFDPNENITGSPFHQQLDWIRLTQVDSVKRGQNFPVLISLNKNPSQVDNLTYYYTSTPQQPTQHLAEEFVAPAPPNRPFKTYIPAINLDIAGDVPAVPNPATFLWDTSNVTPGTYYLCVRAADGVNTATYCSEAQVVVTP